MVLRLCKCGRLRRTARTRQAGPAKCRGGRCACTHSLLDHGMRSPKRRRSPIRSSASTREPASERNSGEAPRSSEMGRPSSLVRPGGLVGARRRPWPAVVAGRTGRATGVPERGRQCQLLLRTAHLLSHSSGRRPPSVTPRTFSCAVGLTADDTRRVDQLFSRPVTSG